MLRGAVMGLLASAVIRLVGPGTVAHVLPCSPSPGYESLCKTVDAVVGFESGAYGNCMVRKGDYPVTITFAHIDDKDLGVAHISAFGCRIELQSNWKWEYMTLRTTVLHEVGHCYGFDHDKDDPRSLMYPSDNPDFDESDVDRFMKRLQRAAELQERNSP